MATGTGIPQGSGIETSRITPDVNLSTGAAEAFEALANAGRHIEETVVDPYLKDKAAQKGAKEGAEIAAGTREYRRPLLGGNEVARARASALESAYTAGVRNDIDAKLAAARVANAYDPEAYDKKAKEIVSGFIQGAPPRFAVDVENYGKDRAQVGMQAVAQEREQRDQQEVVLSLNARETALSQRIVDRISTPGGELTPQFQQDIAEYEALIKTKVDNPAIAYTPEQAALAVDALHDKVQGAIVSRDVVATYNESGRGLPGRAAALRDLSAEFEDPKGAFAGVAPERRQKLFNEAKKTLDTVYAGDRETQRAEDEAERDARAAARDKRGEMLLGVTLGTTSIKDVLADEELAPADKAMLINAVKTAQRRTAADARTAAALERAGRRDVYLDFSDQAAAGVFSPEDAAHAVNAGQLDPGQARTLQAKNDKVLKPIIDDVMSPYLDRARAPGMSMRASKTQQAKAEAEAASWARLNPTAPLDERLKVGDLMAKKYFGGSAGGTPKTQADGARDRLSQVHQLEAQRRAGTITQADFNARRAQLTK